MIKLDLQDIRSLKADGASRKEALTLAPTEVFEQKYCEYRYFYVILVKLMSSNSRISANDITLCCNAFAELKKRIPVECSFLLKTEIALRIISHNTSHERSATARLKRNIETVFKVGISATELCWIHQDYENFLERFYTRERRSSWQPEFHIPLFALHHMHKRENEIHLGKDSLAFLPAEERHIRQDTLIRSSAQSEQVFPQLRQYSDTTYFYSFWMGKLGLLGIERPTSRIVQPVGRDNGLEDVSFELLPYVAEIHKRMVEGFCTLLLRCAGAQSIDAQSNLFSYDSSETQGATIQSDQTTQHQLSYGKDFSSPMNSCGISWANRRETQLSFLLHSESVSRVSYRRKILVAQLQNQSHRRHTPVNSHQVKNDYDDWLGDRTEGSSTVVEEAGALRMLNYYRLRDRCVQPNRQNRNLRDVDIMGKGKALLIEQEDIQVAKRALRLFI
ncbi:30S ribosomal protein S17 [Perkinsela sp. CCAP 1560/4]|nr:30S ribosomal protein S17 [Perkinsela sp. CCAP 1560/4]|eukprot:KNH05248.1 30S ribosomal protein S17 [Perkinsela sp. CCAP 1560/4]